MARPSKIPEKLHAALLDKAGEGLGTRQLAEWLKGQGVEVAHVAVARLLVKLREERSVVTQAVVREKLAPSVATDIERLEKHAARLDRVADQLADGIDGTHGVSAYCTALEQLRRLLETKLHFAGADKPDDSLTELAAASERVRARADRLRARMEPGPDDPGAGSGTG